MPANARPSWRRATRGTPPGVGRACRKTRRARRGRRAGGDARELEAEPATSEAAAAESARREGVPAPLAGAEENEAGERRARGGGDERCADAALQRGEEEGARWKPRNAPSGARGGRRTRSRREGRRFSFVASLKSFRQRLCAFTILLSAPRYASGGAIAEAYLASASRSRIHATMPSSSTSSTLVSLMAKTTSFVGPRFLESHTLTSHRAR